MLVYRRVIYDLDTSPDLLIFCLIWGGIILMISWRELFDCNDGAIKLALHTGCWWKKGIFFG